MINKKCCNCIYADGGTCDNCFGVNGTTEICNDGCCENFVGYHQGS